MNRKKITRFLQSMTTIPLLALAVPLTGFTSVPTPTVVLNQTVSEVSAITTQQMEDRREKAKKIDTFLASYDSPLEGYGMKFVEEAEENGIDWRLLVAIAGRESTFGRHACKKATNSFLGYGSCKINFKSADDSIERVSASLGGNDDKTDHYYAGKNTEQILRKYNSVIPNYPKEVIRIMKMIDKEEII